MSTNTTTPAPKIDPWQAKELGVLWKKTKAGSGDSYLTGTINLKNAGFDKDVSVVCFPNKNKKKDTHPDIKIYISEPRAGGAAPTPAARPVAAATSAEDNQLI